MAYTNHLGNEVKPYKFNERAQDAAVSTMALTGNRTAAAKAAGVHLSTVEDYLKNDAEFRERMREAKGQYVATLEKEAHRRAVEGVFRQRPGPGGTLIDEMVYSDVLLIKLLEANDRAKFGRHQVVERKDDDGKSIGLDQLSPESREKLRRILEEEGLLGDDEDEDN